MIEIKDLSNTEEKSTTCNTMLRALPDWFGIESSIVDYAEQVQSMPLEVFPLLWDEENPCLFMAKHIKV